MNCSATIAVSVVEAFRTIIVCDGDPSTKLSLVSLYPQTILYNTTDWTGKKPAVPVSANPSPSKAAGAPASII